MKVLIQQWAYFSWIGGAEIFTQHLAEHMISRGHQIDIVTGLLSKPSIGWENKSSYSGPEARFLRDIKRFFRIA